MRVVPIVPGARVRPWRADGELAMRPAPLRILWGSPLPPTRSGIADYSAEVLPHLARAAEVEILEPPGWEAPGRAAWLQGLRRRSWDFAGNPGFVSVVHLGNNPYHLWLARRLRALGGIVVLHDTVLHHLLVEEAAADDAWPRFAAELEEAYGRRGSAVAAARRWGYSGLLDPFLFPARSIYLRHARAVLVHTRLAAREVVTSCPGMPVRRIPLAVGRPAAAARSSWRARLGVRRREFLLVHLGFLTPAKGLDVVLRSLVALAALKIAVRLVIVGEGSNAGAFASAVADAGLADRVVAWGYASQHELGGILASADLGLVPRYPTAGETSAAALRFFAAGTPVAVAGYRQFLELPEHAAPRIAPGRAGVVDLVRLVAHLAGDHAAHARARAAARNAWVDGNHAPDRAAAELVQALTELVADVA
jgi:glycosyltransferase involved in cell wall biosynthesis